MKNFVKVVIGGIGSLTRGEEVVVDAHGGSYCIGSVEEKGKPEYAQKKCLVAKKTNKKLNPRLASHVAAGNGTRATLY